MAAQPPCPLAVSHAPSLYSSTTCPATGTSGWMPALMGRRSRAELAWALALERVGEGVIAPEL